MLNKNRKISARVILLVYLTSFFSVTLFHYHDYDSIAIGDHADTAVSVSHQSTGEKNSDVDVDQCSLCLLTNAQFSVFSVTYPALNEAENQLTTTIATDLSILYINFSPKRAPPFIS